MGSGARTVSQNRKKPLNREKSGFTGQNWLKYVTNALKSVFIDRKNYADPKNMIVLRFSGFLGDFRGWQK